MEAAKQFW